MLHFPYAVFDLQFHPTRHSLLAIATSTGSVALFNTNSSATAAPVISQLWTHSAHEDPFVSALFLSWAPRDWFKNPQTDGFAVTFSDGRTTLFSSAKGNISDEDSLSESGIFEAKQTIEMWFVALATIDEKKMESKARIPYIFTGDDFGALYTRQFESITSTSGGDHGDSYDATEVVEEETDTAQMLPLQDFTDRARHHTAGITSILPLPVSLEVNDDAPLLLTGSYDEHLRVFCDTRPGKVLAEHSLGGGVWRLQLLNVKRGEEAVGLDMESDRAEYPRRFEFLVLASCMHAGTRVVKVTWFDNEEDPHGNWTIEVLAEFTEHESMNYASDIWRGGGEPTAKRRQELLCVSSSFYDRRVCVWKFEV